MCVHRLKPANIGTDPMLDLKWAQQLDTQANQKHVYWQPKIGQLENK